MLLLLLLQEHLLLQELLLYQGLLLLLLLSKRSILLQLLQLSVRVIRRRDGLLHRAPDHGGPRPHRDEHPVRQLDVLDAVLLQLLRRRGRVAAVAQRGRGARGRPAGVRDDARLLAEHAAALVRGDDAHLVDRPHHHVVRVHDLPRRGENPGVLHGLGQLAVLPPLLNQSQVDHHGEKDDPQKLKNME